MPSARPVLVVEDDRKTSASIRLYLERSGYAAEPAYDGPSALGALDRVLPLAVILDVMLPGVDGFEICRRLRDRGEVPVLIVSARTDEEDRLRGLRLGADDYLTKPFSPRELVARLEAVLRRAGARPSAVPGLSLDPRKHVCEVAGSAVPLTPTEFRVLRLFLETPDRVFTREEVIRYALGSDFDGFDRTVDAHIMNVRRKVRRAGGPEQVIATVFGVGYRLAAAEPA